MMSHISCIILMINMTAHCVFFFSFCVAFWVSGINILSIENSHL